MRGLAARGAERDIAAWTEACRLNPAAGAGGRAADPDVAGAWTSMAQDFGPAMANLAHRLATTPAERPDALPTA